MEVVLFHVVFLIESLLLLLNLTFARDLLKKD